MRNEKETTDMKTPNPIPLRFVSAECVSFTLPIHKKALHPILFPFSAKKIFISKGVKDETERHFQR